ncbi:hypothetical protein [Xanthomonas hortorum]|uniref:Cellulose biosynthesis protein BcsS n=1 Tax=Xanthomonas hortorum pv. pelargonii TaxID=453602 RepID=A0A6V7DE35_9XANT|nr:hypothetical protein [Xanthomonas hortorum]MCE4353240.1 hypothetical protein [Xanthomonas hortorum pv. pelargonii]MCM5524157.1 hypothetical protein [Xanthomonas hortorum pv. pelargonii]MCM5536469.1 hypothetical protein [Xanthomonas hortorum pv. pelargonii]MCM5540661.1 hypothetical protein [Xanthomonas hortorum pv. pelargonii]MCM5544237.1 hypothetical protein [Xanthomonas hortorum pv. pelargonii]
MSLKLFPALLLAAASVLAFRAQAAASLTTDDAALTPEGRCQVETWLRGSRPGRELTAVPACTWAGNEVSLGLSTFSDQPRAGIAALGAKRLFRDLDQQRWGVGASLGANWDLRRQRLDGLILNVPVSIALDADRRSLLHLNVGANTPCGSAMALTASVGVEHTLGPAWTVLAEAFGDDRGGFGQQAGLRRLFGDRASVDLLAGYQHGADHTPWVTLGFNLLLPD